MDVINEMTALFAPTSKNEMQAFLVVMSFWRMHIPDYCLIVNFPYLLTRNKNNFAWGLEQQEDFEQIKLEIVHAVALGPVWTGPDVKNMLYTTVRENGSTWSLWKKVSGET